MDLKELFCIDLIEEANVPNDDFRLFLAEAIRQKVSQNYNKVEIELTPGFALLLADILETDLFMEILDEDEDFT